MDLVTLVYHLYVISTTESPFTTLNLLFPRDNITVFRVVRTYDVNVPFLLNVCHLNLQIDFSKGSFHNFNTGSIPDQRKTVIIILTFISLFSSSLDNLFFLGPELLKPLRIRWVHRFPRFQSSKCQSFCTRFLFRFPQ